MLRTRSRRYWIVKHGYDALTALPNYIWRTGQRHEPPVFQRVAVGDRWVGFAYANNDRQERPLSLITGFFECVQPSRFLPLPRRAREISGRTTKAWLIKGTAHGRQPGSAVGVPPINELLGRRTFNQNTLIEISRDEYANIRKEVLRRELNPGRIPLLKREPRYEQEVLAVVACGHEKLGIEKILRIRNAFPDMTVKLRGRAEPVHVELEVYSRSFLTHGHHQQVDSKGRYPDSENGKRNRYPVGLLCWIDDEQRAKLKRHGIDRVFELQRLIREGGKLRWGR